MKTHELDELIAQAEAGQPVAISVDGGPPFNVEIDDLYIARGLARYLEQAKIELASRYVEHAAANLHFELWQPDAAQAAGFGPSPLSVAVTLRTPADSLGASAWEREHLGR